MVALHRLVIIVLAIIILIIVVYNILSIILQYPVYNKPLLSLDIKN